jgi:hypothetical protein
MLRGATAFDHVPEFRIVLQCLVLGDGQAGTEKEILEAVLAENAMDDDAEFVAFEVHAIVSHAESMKNLAAAFEFAEAFQFRADDLLGNATEFAENGELKLFRHFRQFSGAGRIKDDLKRTHATVEGCRLKVAGSTKKREDPLAPFNFKHETQVGSAYGSRTRL